MLQLSVEDQWAEDHGIHVGYCHRHKVKVWDEYCEDCDDPTGTVYAYVPIGLVVDFINEHGGSRLSY